ncbi:hypothetical protein QCA50_014129 [Cerrena zonata]|uniref:Uncharacterized protein n=1 Tax=Cerrena zonata TaxID=2478898 RepID=A0AAW0FPS7_9APHY
MMNRRELPRAIPSIREHLHLQSKKEAEEQVDERLKEAEMRWLKGGEVLKRTREALQREREALQRAREALQQAWEDQVVVSWLRKRKAKERVREAKERVKEAKERVKEAEERVRGAEEWVRGAKEQMREVKERRLRGTPLRLEA